MLSGVEDPRESPVVLLRKVPRLFLFSLFSFRTVYRRFVLSFRLQFEENFYSLATNICGLNHLLKNSVSGFSKFLV